MSSTGKLKQNDFEWGKQVGYEQGYRDGYEEGKKQGRVKGLEEAKDLFSTI
jgi:flagellar biosynthesis/type III secretory pathway protein FliH